MHENDSGMLNTNAVPELTEPTSAAHEAVQSAPIIPKPVFMRLLMLFGGGIGCLLVGIVVSMVTGDLVMLAMSAILCVAFVAKGVLLKRKIGLGQIFSVSGVCVGIVPKILNRYRRIELVNTDTGGDVQFILPKKVIFKIGHVYCCYFDHPVNNHPVSLNKAQGGFFNADMDLPTNGFLGFEDFGVYQEKPVTITAAMGAKTGAKSDAAPPATGTADHALTESMADNCHKAPQNTEIHKEET